MSNNLSKTAVLKKKLNCKLKLQQRILLTNFGVVNVLKFLQTLVLDFPYICLQFFPGNFSRKEEKFLQTKKNKSFSRMQLHIKPSIFFSILLRREALGYNSYFFQKSRFTEIIRH